jgi:hypothetical protein
VRLQKPWAQGERPKTMKERKKICAIIIEWPASGLVREFWRKAKSKKEK